MIDIIKAVGINGLVKIELLANKIWHAHYTPIIGKPQVDYMLHKFQSVKSMQEQIDKGFMYYIIAYNNKEVGYVSIKKEARTLFLSKLYVLSAYRGKQIGSTALEFIENKTRKYSLEGIRLTVNKHNTDSIKIYEKWGFTKHGNIVIDIGEGFVMDDFEMFKKVEFM